MKLKNYFIVLFLCFYSISKAQIVPSDSMSRVVNVHALALISNYEDAIQFKNKSNYDNFLKLFHSNSTLLFNDVMPHNKLQEKVTPAEYIQLIKKYYADTSFVSVTVNPYEMGLVTFEGNDAANISILAYKQVVSIARSGLYYIDTFNVRFDILYDFETQKYEITNIASVDRRDSYLQVYPQYRGFLNKSSLKNDSIYVNGVLFPVNNLGYTQLKNVNLKSEFLFVPFHNEVLFKMFRVPDNIPLIKNKVDYKKDKNLVKINFWKWMVFVDFQYHFIPDGSSPIKTKQDTLGVNPLNQGSFSNFIMMNITRRVSNKGYWSIKFGGGADVFNYQLNLASQHSKYFAVDPDGDTYLRTNKVFDIRETHNLVYATAPFILQKGFTFGKNSVYVQAVYYLMLKYSASYKMDARATYSGYYEQLFNLTISENGVYDFGTYDFKLRGIPLLPKSITSSYGLGIGYNRQLSRKAYFDFGINYRTSSDYLFQENPKRLSDSYLGLNSLTNLNHRLKVDYLNMNFGISIKL